MPNSKSSSGLMNICVVVALGWVIPGAALALMAPWMTVHAPAADMLLRWFAPLVTVLFIAWNLIEGIIVVGRSGRALAAWPMTAVQLVLFTLLFFQISCHLGADHFEFRRAPQWWDWLLFVAAHAVRAGDVIDIIEAYGLNLQTIQHESNLVAICLVFLHLILDLFLLRLLFEGVGRFRDQVLKDIPREARWGVAGGAVILFLAAWLISALWVRPWRGSDMILWLIDNLIRVGDFADAMELFHIRLHSIPKSPWENTLTFFCRLIFAVGLGTLVARGSVWVSLTMLGGFGLSEDDLEKARTDPKLSDELRRAANLRLIHVRVQAHQPNSVPWFTVAATVLILAGVIALLAAWPPWRERTMALVAMAIDPQHPRQQPAHDALRRMGARADAAIEPLSGAAARTGGDERARHLHTLGFLGPAGQHALATMSREAAPELALAAVEAINARGADAAPLLVAGFESPHAPVREAARSAVRGHGKAALPSLIEAVSPENARTSLELFEELDPDYWHLYPSRNAHMREIKRLHQPLRVLKQSDPSSTDLVEAAQTLGAIGPSAAVAIPMLVPRVQHPDPAVRQAISAALPEILVADPGMIPVLTELLGPKSTPELRVTAAQRLGEIGPPARACIPRLVALLPEPGREQFREAIRRLGVPAADAVAPLVALLGSTDAETAQTSEMLLNAIDRQWRRHPSVESTVTALSAQLSAADAPSRNAGARGLGVIGPPAKKSITSLIEVLTDEKRQNAAEAAFAALERIDPEWTKSANARVVFRAFVRMSRWHPNKAAMQGMLRQLFPVAYPTAQDMVQALREEQFEEGKNAILELLTQQGDKAREAVPELIRMVDLGKGTDRDADFTRTQRSTGSVAAFQALERIDANWVQHPQAAALVSSFIWSLDGGFSGTTDHAKRLLTRLAAANAQAVPTIIRLVSFKPNASGSFDFNAADESLEARRTRLRTLEFLGSLNRVPEESIPELALLSSDQSPVDPEVRSVVAKLLDRAHPNWKSGSQGRSAAVRILRDVKLVQVSPRAQGSTFSLLRSLIPGAKEAVPPLIDLLSEQTRDQPPLNNEDLRNPGTQMDVWEKQLRDFMGCVDSLEELLNAADPTWRDGEHARAGLRNLDTYLSRAKNAANARPELALYALHAFGPAARDIAMPLVQQLMKSNPRLLDLCARVIAKVGLEKRAAANLLLQILVQSKASPRVALQVARGLGEVGPATRDVIPALIQLVTYTSSTEKNAVDQPVRIAATNALAKIGPAAKAALPVLRQAAKLSLGKEHLAAIQAAIDAISAPN